jgi:hypothetical protein
MPKVNRLKSALLNPAFKMISRMISPWGKALMDCGK